MFCSVTNPLIIWNPGRIKFHVITSIYRQLWPPYWRISIVVSSIVEESMNKIVLRIRVDVDDWTAERAIIAINVFL